MDLHWMLLCRKGVDHNIAPRNSSPLNLHIFDCTQDVDKPRCESSKAQNKPLLEPVFCHTAGQHVNIPVIPLLTGKHLLRDVAIESRDILSRTMLQERAHINQKEN